MKKLIIAVAAITTLLVMVQIGGAGDKACPWAFMDINIATGTVRTYSGLSGPITETKFSVPYGAEKAFTKAIKAGWQFDYFQFDDRAITAICLKRRICK